MHNQLIDIVYNSKGGITFTEIYKMPIWLRKHSYYALAERIKKENEQIENASKPKQKSNTKPTKTKSKPK